MKYGAAIPNYVVYLCILAWKDVHDNNTKKRIPEQCKIILDL